MAAIMGADGVILAAASAHQVDASRLGAASSVLLFHATAVLGTVSLTERGLVHPKIGIVAAWGFVVAAVLFATDLTLRQYGQVSLAFAAPAGGTLLILSWLLLALAAAWPHRGS